MDSRHVTAEQARAIGQWVDPTVQRLMQLQRRMDDARLPQTDKLYVRVACDARRSPTSTAALSFYNDPTYFPLPLEDEPPPAR